MDGVDFEAFVAQHGDALAGLAAGLCGNRLDAEELLAEAFAKVWEHWDRVARAARPEMYARRIVVNAHIDEIRRRTRQRTAAIRLMAEPQGTTEAVAEVVVRAEQVSRYLDSIPGKERAALVLRHYLGLSASEIASVIGCSSSAARVYLSRGHSRVAAAVTEERESTP